MALYGYKAGKNPTNKEEKVDQTVGGLSRLRGLEKVVGLESREKVDQEDQVDLKEQIIGGLENRTTIEQVDQ